MNNASTKEPEKVATWYESVSYVFFCAGDGLQFTMFLTETTTPSRAARRMHLNQDSGSRCCYGALLATKGLLSGLMEYRCCEHSRRWKACVLIVTNVLVTMATTTIVTYIRLPARSASTHDCRVIVICW